MSDTGVAETEFTVVAAQGALVATGDASTLPAAILFVLVTAFVGAGTLILKGSRS